jgi:hypothetical protein
MKISLMISLMLLSPFSAFASGYYQSDALEICVHMAENGSLDIQFEKRCIAAIENKKFDSEKIKKCTAENFLTWSHVLDRVRYQEQQLTCLMDPNKSAPADSNAELIKTRAQLASCNENLDRARPMGFDQRETKATASHVSAAVERVYSSHTSGAAK